MKSSSKNQQAAQRQRENEDPDEGIRPLPWFFVMSLGALAMWGAFYIYSTPSGDESAFGDQRTVSTLRPVSVASGKGAGSDAAKAIDGKQIFIAKCVACHQSTGLGLAGVFPPLAGAEWVLGDEKVLINILLHGVKGALEVKGATYNGAMPAWKSLNDDELAGLLTYIRADWGNNAAPIKADTIKMQRELTKARTEPYNGGPDIQPGS
jgi:mono/diheme cytochrome c family protein